MSGGSKPQEKEITVSESELAQIVERLVVKGIKEREKFREIDERDADVRPGEYINVMSLVPMRLNLSTQGNGRGKVYRFERFGQIKRIVAADIGAIIDSHPTFTESGYFYILDRRLVILHGLQDVYMNILSKEKIDKIINEGGDGAIELYEVANPKQQEIIRELLVIKVRDNRSGTDLNVVEKISSLSGVDIIKMADEAREQIKIEEEEKEGKKKNM